ncbi:MAG: hypothetical protein KA715_13925 [Xanthomonadaceae bacterium]|nr:hypothetical protein [Xanthomonadaceae bacterium]
MNLKLISLAILSILSTQTQAKPRTQEHPKACPIVVLASADGKTQDLPTRSAKTNFENNGRIQMTIVMKADVMREDNLAHGEIEKQKEFKIVAIPFVSQKVNTVCGTEVTLKYFIRSEREKEYYLRITGEDHKTYKEFTKRLDNQTEDTEVFSFVVNESKF